MKRLDLYLCENGYAHSRTEAKLFVEGGAVIFDGKTVTKPSFSVDESVFHTVTVDKSQKKYVSRGGFKLEGALREFGISSSDRVCLDVGASSGGFTDCLLQNGARLVYAVDSGSGQLADSIRQDSRVLVFEGYNARYMTRSDFEIVPTLAVMDVSFISATYIIPAIFEVLSSDSDFVCLIKPQFEVGRANIGKGGIVKDDKARRAAVEKVVSFAVEIGFEHIKTVTSSIRGGDGNIEFLAHFKKLTGRT